MAKDKWESWFKWLMIFLAFTALVLAMVTIWVVLARVHDQDTADMAMARLKIILTYEILILTFFYGLMVLLYMAAGEIDLTMLLCEPKGNDQAGNPIYGASMSRFQLLIFIFVIALSLVLITVATGAKKFPAIPSEILVLLGISASTYAVGKGIQSSSSAAADDGKTGGNGGNGGNGDDANVDHPAVPQGGVVQQPVVVVNPAPAPAPNQ